MRSPSPAALFAAAVLALAGVSCRVEDGRARELKTREFKRKDGSVYQTTTFYLGPAGEEVKHGPDIYWHENGRKHIELHYRDGKRHGKLTEWYDDGQKAREGQWADNKEQGVWTAWQEGGRKAWQCTYVDGKIRGKKTYWTGKTKTREETYDENGTLVETTTWHQFSDKKLSHGTYKGGLPHGRWTYWGPKGTVLADGEWRDGKPWNGTCAVPVPGDAGSWGGIKEVGLYREGKLVKKMGRTL